VQALADTFAANDGTAVLHDTIQYLVERSEHETAWLEVLAASTVPTTLVWGDADSAILRAGIERSGRWVDASYHLEVLEDVSHWIATQAPGQLARIVLERIGPAGEERA